MRVPALPAAALVTALLTGCTGSVASAPEVQDFPTPPLARFSPGTCSVAAPDVLAVAAVASDLGEGPKVDPTVAGRLRETQERLRDVAQTAEPTLKPALDTLVTRMGLVRLAADAERFDAERTRDLREGYDGVLAVCAGGSAAAGSG